MILLKSAYVTGHLAMEAMFFESQNILLRNYFIKNNFVEIDGAGNDAVALHDAELICGMVGYQLATPAEQDAYAKAQNDVGKLVEDVGKVEEDAPADLPAPGTALKSAGSEKKANGG